MKTSAKRKLLPEADILILKQRVELGVPLNRACKLLHPEISNVVVIRLVNWHTELAKALGEEEFMLYDAMHNSLYPPWLPNEQPDEACYAGEFPYGQWEMNV
jgi:hypothetical protein